MRYLRKYKVTLIVFVSLEKLMDMGEDFGVLK